MTRDKHGIEQDSFYQMFCMHPQISINLDEDKEFVVKIGKFETCLGDFDFGLMMEKMEEISNAARIALTAYQLSKDK
jgi:hypothetical protein